ncbi:hypothetical protein GCM10022631_08690 [Deinococcus rubellus]|uniref:Aldehyde-activating protein n=1 Tax=Deinococcus rubellus TaxID=1889240 RepID=A0ABY5YIX9_9DEIO|nr:hypothetical protein [Deinococcus rubellus]UWX64209.1 hypothetical protein N0D28_00585 [Deinococcus rubellus]
MTKIDPRRSVPARRDLVEGGLGGVNVLNPGEVRPLSELAAGQPQHVGYLISCPGCGAELSIYTAGPRQFHGESGDLDARTLSFDAPITHDCGWAGHLHLGIFVPV